MAKRVVYGLSNSENGWEMVDTGSCVWVKVPGTNVTLQIREGQPAAIMGAFAADFNVNVEPLRDADSACWTATNSVPSSNHLSGTGMDLNWNGPDGKTFRYGISKEQAYPGDKSPHLDELIDFYEGMIFCGGNWSNHDWMHMQMNGNTYGSNNVEKVNDFIRRKIRSDGFSTFKRTGPVPPPPPPPPASLSRAESYALRIMNEGRRRNITPKGIQIAFATAIVESNITVYANEKLPKSLALPHDAVGRDGLSVGIFQQQVKDSGNGWWWGDEVTCMGVESSAGLFYDRLAKLPYNGNSLTPGGFAQKIQGSAFPARYDEHFGEAVALYNKLAGILAPPPDVPTTPGEDMAQVPQDQWDRVYHELVDRRQSRSPLRHVGEGVTDTWSGFGLNTDGHGHVQLVKLLASYEDPEALALLQEVALNTEPGREHDALLAQAILHEVTSPPVVPASVTVQGDVTPQVVYVDRPVAAPLAAPVEAAPQSTGQVIGAAFDALAALNLSGVLSDIEKAPLAALIAVLQTKTAGNTEGSAS